MIRVDTLRKQIGGQQILDGISMTIRRGEIVAVVGASGTGKSVLLKHISA